MTAAEDRAAGDPAARLTGRRVSGVIALSPRSLAIAFGERPRSYFWIHLDRKLARLALADRLPSSPDPRGSPFGPIEGALRGLVVTNASFEEGGLELGLAPRGSDQATHRLRVAAERTRVNLIVTGGAEGGVLWAFHREDEGGVAEEPPEGFRPPRVTFAADAASEDSLATAVASAFSEDFRRHLTKELQTAARSLARRQEAQEGDLRRARSHVEARRWGEILLAHYGEIPRGASRVRLPDPFADSPETTVDIPIDPSLSPHENAARLFQKAKKGDRGERLVETRLKRTRDERAALDALGRNLFDRPPREALRALRAFLESAGLPLPRGDTRTIGLGRQTAGAPRGLRPGRRSPGALESIRPRTFHTRDGWEVWVGRNNVDNDRITHRLSNPHDIWFHVVGVPGSHVILRRPARSAIPKPRTLEEAASIAAYYSKARKQSRVPVIYTERKFVSKPRRGKPGQAICTRERELLVRPRLPEADAGPESEREVSS